MESLEVWEVWKFGKFRSLEFGSLESLIAPEEATIGRQGEGFIFRWLYLYSDSRDASNTLFGGWGQGFMFRSAMLP